MCISELTQHSYGCRLNNKDIGFFLVSRRYITKPSSLNRSFRLYGSGMLAADLREHSSKSCLKVTLCCFLKPLTMFTDLFAGVSNLYLQFRLKGMSRFFSDFKRYLSVK